MNDKAINTDLLFISIDLGLVHSGSNVKSAMSVRYDRSMLRGRLPLRCDPVVGGGRPHKSFAFTGCICSLLFGGLEAAFSRLSLLASFIAAGDLSPDHTHTHRHRTLSPPITDHYTNHFTDVGYAECLSSQVGVDRVRLAPQHSGLQNHQRSIVWMPEAKKIASSAFVLCRIAYAFATRLSKAIILNNN